MLLFSVSVCLSVCLSVSVSLSLFTRTRQNCAKFGQTSPLTPEVTRNPLKDSVATVCQKGQAKR